MKLVLSIVGIIVGLILVICGIGYGLQFGEKARWGEYRYRISDSDTYWYTNEYSIKDNCIHFKNNYGNKTQYCEKYRVTENYFHSHSPTLTTLIWGAE